MKGKMEYKFLQSEVKEANDQDLTVVHFISTEQKDRGMDIMRAKGMVINGKPVVLFMHGFGQYGQEPIAKPVWIRPDSNKGIPGICVKTQFYDDEDGRRLYKKAKTGFAPNWSIGYIALEYDEGKDDDGYFRDVKKWELLEYSMVGVPMNPGAVCVETGKEHDCHCAKSCGSKGVRFKILSPAEEREEKNFGELCENKDGKLVDMEGKPYPNEHACRLESPSKYDRFRRANNKFGKGIHAIWGIKEGKPVELQAIRFSTDKFTAEEAKSWLKDHDYKCKSFEAASGKGIKKDDDDHLAPDNEPSMDEEIHIKLVDATKVRDELDIDFTMGGNYGAYPDYIPYNEIWIEANQDLEDLIATRVHEFTERDMMLFYGLDYDTAHTNFANPVEHLVRDFISNHNYTHQKGGDGEMKKCPLCGSEMVWKKFADDPDEGIWSCDACKAKKTNKCKCDNKDCGHTVSWSANCNGMKCLKCGKGKLRAVEKPKSFWDKEEKPFVKDGVVLVNVHIETFKDVDPCKDERFREVLAYANGFLMMGTPISIKADDGTTLALQYQVKKAFPYHRSPKANEDEDWEAEDETTKAEIEELKHMACYHTGDGTKKGQYKLIHHRAAKGDHATVWKGVRNAAAAIMGARGFGDEDDEQLEDEDMKVVKAHIKGHYKDFGRDKCPWEEEDGKMFLAMMKKNLDDESVVTIARELIPELAEFFEAEIKKAIPYKKTPLAKEGEAWDGSGERAKASTGDLLIMCAWYDQKNPDTKSSYKLPHHKAGGQHACVWNGVRAAYGALMGSRGANPVPAADKSKVQSHLFKHYKDFGKEPPKSQAEFEALEKELTEEIKAMLEDMKPDGVPEPKRQDNHVDNRDNNPPAEVINVEIGSPKVHPIKIDLPIEGMVLEMVKEEFDRIRGRIPDHKPPKK